MPDLLTFHDLRTSDLETLLRRARAWKASPLRRAPLKGKVVGLLFEKPSTRTRVAFETAVVQLGGHPLTFSRGEVQLVRGETIADTARVLSSYLHAMIIRTSAHRIVEEWARWATVPVINGLTDLHHPSQVLADLFTMQARRGRLRGARVAYIGDGNNVANSLIQGAVMTGLHLVIACPVGYEPNEVVLRTARLEAKRTGAKLEVVRDPEEAAAGADFLYTDVWTSMGREAEQETRRRVFQGYQVSERLLKVAQPGALVMHCLPAHRGEEITEEALESKASIVFEQSANRLPMSKAILEWCVR